MSRALLISFLLTACAQFPQVDAAAPPEIPARPPFLAPDALAAVNAQADDIPTIDLTDQGRDLQSRADALREK
ncbi:MAG: hypothetical protein U5N55_14130 [Cypionkella sp.]|nr:hypothetical protein [Cypionkella sp.]